MYNTDITNPSQVLTFQDAKEKLPEGLTFDQAYRTLRLTVWSDARNDYVHEKSLYQSRDLEPNWTMRIGHDIYRIGQVSGSAMSLIWYEKQ